MTRPSAFTWLFLTLLVLAVSTAGFAQTVTGYSPSQTTEGYLPSSNLPVTIFLEGIQYAPAPYINRAYWVTLSGTRTQISVTGTPGATQAVVSVPPQLRIAGQYTVSFCGVINLDSGQVGCTNVANSAKFTVNPPPSITSTSPLPGGRVGAAYSFTFAATGGTLDPKLPIYAWSISAGTLPPGLTLSPSTGILSGTPTTGGAYSFTVRATDVLGVAGTKAFTLSIQPRAVTSYSPAATTVGYLPSSNLSIVTTLQNMPTGLVSSTRAFWNNTRQPISVTAYSGTAATVSVPPNYRTIPGSNVVIVCATPFGTNPVEVCTSAADSAVFIVNPPPSITSTSPLPSGVQGTAYSFTFSATGGTGARTWSVSSGLPPGLSLNSATGQLSGTPTQGGAYEFNVAVVDSLGVVGTAPFSLTIRTVTVPAVISFSPPATTVGYLPSANLPLSMSLQGMPQTGINLRAYWNTVNFPLTVTSYVGTAATVSVPPAYRATSGNYLVVVCATLATTGQETCTNESASVRFPVNPAPSITTASPLPEASTETPYSVGLSATGGTGTLAWSLAAGSSLPAGLSLNAASGAISGTPTQPGIFNFTVVVTDSLGVTGSKLFAILVTAELTITTPPNLPTAGVGVAYSTAIQAAGGVPPYSFSALPQALPPGLVFNGSTGVLSGTPSIAGSYSFVVVVFDTQQHSASRTFFIEVSQTTSTPTIQTPSPLPDATLGQPYTLNFTAAGGFPPYRFLRLSGQFPEGLTLNSETGTLAGIVTEAGTFNFVIEVMDSREQLSSKAFSLTVTQGLTITTSQLPAGTVGVVYPSTPIQVSGGLPPYSFTLGTANLLPAGLFLNPNTGVISGTPSQAGVFAFQVLVVDSQQRSASRNLSITVGTGLRFRTTSPLPDGRVGDPYSQEIEAEGGTAPYSFQLLGGALPSGITFTAGRLQGTPTAPYEGVLLIRATDSGTPALSAERQFSLRITAPLAITTETLPAGTVQDPYSVAISATGGVPAYSFSISAGNLPAGLVLNPNGTLSGTPTVAGSFAITVRATDTLSNSATRNYTLQIRPRPVTGATVTLQTTNPAPSSQPEVDVGLNEPRADAIDGVLILEFAPSVTPAVDDPAIQFTSGGRQRSFQIPAGQTSARFGEADRATFQTGTVAGAITIRAQLRVNGADATPTPPPASTVVLPPLAPTLSSLSVTRSQNGLTVVIRGFSTPRNMNTATLNFTARAGSNITSGLSFTVNLASAFTTWYGSASSAQYGSQFQLTIPVTISGDSTEITGLSVVLNNSVGASNTLNATF